MITIDDDETIVAFLDMVENHKMIVENSGSFINSCILLLNFTGKKVVSILSGGNMDVITMSSVVQHGDDSERPYLYRFRIDSGTTR